MKLVPALAVLCSGSGTNFQAILDAVRRRRLKARVALMLSDNPGAFAVERAHRAGVPTVIVDRRRFAGRPAFERKLAQAIDQAGASWIVLAGFMRVLSPWFVKKYRSHIVNIHPALLPLFPGPHGIRDALAHGARVTGVTVHLVDEQVDHGPILAQQTVPIKPKDTEETLLERVHRVEHRLYPETLQRLLHANHS